MNGWDNWWVEMVVDLMGGLGDGWMWFLIRSELIGLVGIGALGWLASYGIERRHLAMLEKREADLGDISVTQTLAVPATLRAADSTLLVASVVLSRGVFRMLIVTLRKLLGRGLPGYVLLLERARREALLRLKEAARERGVTTVINLRFETTRISSKGMPVVEVMVYGTALAIAPGGAARHNAGHA